MSPSPSQPTTPTRPWTFLSNHAHVLICLASEPDPRLRVVAQRVGITERAVQKILDDLEAENILSRRRVGRTNQYVLHLDSPLRHPLEAHRTVRELIELVTAKKKRKA
jgi:DNA-binding MarR family transcriptional regulator